MKKIVVVLLAVAMFLPACVEQMTEAEGAKVAGIWAAVNENDMTSRFFVFDNGYLYEYNSSNTYYVHDNILWVSQYLKADNAFRYRYTLLDGNLHYSDYYQDVRVSLKYDGDTMMLGDLKCVQIKEVTESYYSRIVFSETNRKQFFISDRYVEWKYEIDNPVPDMELLVSEAPEWCGGRDGVTVEDGKICFTITQDNKNLEGRFVFTYLSAKDLVVDVTHEATAVVIDRTSESLEYKAGSYSFNYDVKGRFDQEAPSVETDCDWITDIKDEGGKVMYSVLVNSANKSRVGRIKLTYHGISADCCITQSRPFTKIILEDSGDILTCNAASYSFAYSVEDMLEGLQLSTRSDCDWIRVLNDDGRTITYSVDENNSGAVRSGKIILNYSDQSEEYSITQSYSRGYSYWIGDWTITGANGLVQTVRLSPGVPDSSFLMTGYLGLPDEAPISVDWNEADQTWELSNQNFGRFYTPRGWTGDAWLFGMSDHSYMMKAGIPICIGMIAQDGTLTAVPYEGWQSGFDGYYKVDCMYVVVYKGTEHQVYVPAQSDECPTFPFTITPAVPQVRTL